jgi:prevent-host-death family protein
MKKMAAGKFKSQCLSVMKQVQATGEPVLVTKRGAPLAKVVAVEPKEEELFGFLSGQVQITGDIESPVVPVSAWRVMKK